MATRDISVGQLWRVNGNRQWMRHLREVQSGKDWNTINHWVTLFLEGAETILTVDSDLIVTDGHHRLIAAKRANVDTIKVRICPQRTTYR